jgi:hypothetical protein
LSGGKQLWSPGTPQLPFIVCDFSMKRVHGEAREENHRTRIVAILVKDQARTLAELLGGFSPPRART